MIVVNRYLTVCANDWSDEFNYIVCNGSTLHKKHPYLNRSNVKLLDSCFQEVFDTCNGHAEPNQNSYHYHKLPIRRCLTRVMVTRNRTRTPITTTSYRSVSTTRTIGTRSSSWAWRSTGSLSTPRGRFEPR